MSVCSWPAAAGRLDMNLNKLMRKNGIKIAPGFSRSVEDCSLAVGQVVGHSSMKSTARRVRLWLWWRTGSL